MSDSNRAVFLSYASQDTDAARAIAEALRAAGIEVWFDQNELVGGDAWDAKIRKQIAECALFVPVISAATQARREGYFRIEWRLAAQRTHAMSDDTTFLLPLVIDGTGDAEARVPAEFKTVQWTRLCPVGFEGQAAVDVVSFGGRVKALLGREWDSTSVLHAPAGASLANHASRARGGTESVAVLPFANTSADPENEYFAEGIADELLMTLQKIPGLRVSARPSAWSFKGKSAGVREVGAALGVAHVVEGSVQKAGPRVRIIVRLSRADSNELVWSKHFGPLELVDVFATQSEIAQAIVGEVRGRLGAAADDRARTEIQTQVQFAQRGATQNPEAQRLFLLGRYFADRVAPDEAARGAACYERALELDPEFVLGWAALSRVRMWQGTWEPQRAARFQQAREAAQRALALDPDCAEARAVLSQVLQRHYFDWNGMRREIAQAVALAPLDASILTDACSSTYTLGEWERAIDFGRRAIALDPLNSSARLLLGVTCLFSGRLAEAREELRRALEVSPQGIFTHLVACMVELEAGNPEAALAFARNEPARMHRLEGLALAEFACGRRAEADVAAQALAAEFSEASPYKLAHIYASRGDPDRAFEWLERAWTHRDPGICWVKVAVLLRKLHGDPRWPVFLRKVGLSDEQLR